MDQSESSYQIMAPQEPIVNQTTLSLLGLKNEDYQIGSGGFDVTDSIVNLGEQSRDSFGPEPEEIMKQLKMNSDSQDASIPRATTTNNTERPMAQFSPKIVDLVLQ